MDDEYFIDEAVDDIVERAWWSMRVQQLKQDAVSCAVKQVMQEIFEDVRVCIYSLLESFLEKEFAHYARSRCTNHC